MKSSILTGLICGLLGLAAPAFAASVIRGPYLQSGTDHSVVIRWRTDVPTDGRVTYGTTLGVLDQFVDGAAAVVDHEVLVMSLAANALYYYAVGTPGGVLAGDDADHAFLTSPPQGAAVPLRVWVLGDSGTANSNAMAVRDAFETFNGGPRPDLWLMLGDNAYPDGTDSEYQAAVFDIYPETLRSSVLWPAIGNHDAHSADSATESGPYYDIFTLPRNGEAGGVASGTEAYYSFDFANVHFVCLDSQESDRSPGGAMLLWLEQDLQATDAEWIIAFWHHPPYSKGSHDSDSETRLIEMRENALPVLEDYGVDLVLAGHSHAYERSVLIDSHYGTSGTLDPSMVLDPGDGRTGGDGAYVKQATPTAHDGAVYAVAGSSGQAGGGSLNHPVMFLSVAALGSMVLDIDTNVLDATFVDSSGSTLDTFRVQKTATCNALDRPRIVVRRTGTDPVAGNEVLKFRGEQAAAGLVSIDSLGVLQDGIRLTLTGVNATLAQLDIPGGSFDGTRGWDVNSSNTRLKYKDKAKPPLFNGISTVKLRRKGSGTDTRVGIAVRGKMGSYPIDTADLPLQSSLELGTPGGFPCAETSFALSQCSFNTAGDKVVCR